MSKSYSSGVSGVNDEPFEFDVDGVEFRSSVDGGVSLLDLSELMAVADEDANSPRGAAALARIFREALGAQEYARFRAHAAARKTPPEVIVTIMRDLVDHVMRPTRRPGQSSPGPLPINGSSPVNLPSDGDQFSPQDMARLRAILANGSATSSPGWPPVTA